MVSDYDYLNDYDDRMEKYAYDEEVSKRKALEKINDDQEPDYIEDLIGVFKIVLLMAISVMALRHFI